ncbi:hypothetical protein [Leptospira stimsonii]|uniref:DUF1574 domain-containing protein n=1 Tax=Leptospira stimsonii TaxID=2202203 RepID=A0ABY2N3X5_9LEPT|nr:hypothetical protein [Leptospira stimsonii]TGK22999.1 hypothetical protein EHO98_06945 [Leptospira stimsonii]TGM16568.1 hypothetical protein EHQ90_09320 [Leptospira stimsonii]
MDPVSSTSSSKTLRYVSLFFTLLLSVIVLDRISYSFFFSQYDKMFSLYKNFKPSNVLIVGSSHILWDLDPVVLTKELKQPVTLLNIPGANLTLRKEIVGEYMRKNGNQKPSLLVLEADKFVFHKGRYPDSAYKSVKGYYHKGMFTDFLDRKVPEESFLEYWMFRISHSYSLNSFSHFIFSKLYDKYISSIFIWKLNASEEENGEKIRNWKNQYEHLSPKIEKDLVQELYEILKFARDNGAKVVLLETPNYFFSEEENRKYDSVRKELMKIAEDSGSVYLRLDPGLFETKSEFFFDASHLNLLGKAAYTDSFQKELRKKSLF